MGKHIKAKVPNHDPTCKLCGQAEEDELHVFSICLKAV